MNVTRNIVGRSVRAKVVRRRETHERYFSLRQYGTWEKAEAAAKSWLRKLRKDLPTSIPREGRMSVRNHSGIVGVHRSPGRSRNSKGKIQEHPRWIARWPGCPIHGGLGWSVKAFDEEGAFALAVLARRLKSIDRERVLQELDRIIDTAEFDELFAGNVVG